MRHLKQCDDRFHWFSSLRVDGKVHLLKHPKNVEGCTGVDALVDCTM